MAKIIIRKRINLGFLGKDYEDGFVEFKSLTVRDVQDKLDKITSAADDNKKSAELMVNLLKECFLNGKFVNGGNTEDINREDLDDFDIRSIIKFFGILTGQDDDPKAGEL